MTLKFVEPDFPSWWGKRSYRDFTDVELEDCRKQHQREVDRLRGRGTHTLLAQMVAIGIVQDIGYEIQRRLERAGGWDADGRPVE